MPPTPKLVEVPPEPPSVEDRLLDLFQKHLASNEQAMREMGTKLDGVGTKIEETSNRVFYLALAILLVLAASTGATLYLRLPDGTTVTTNGAPTEQVVP